VRRYLLFVVAAALLVVAAACGSTDAGVQVGADDSVPSEASQDGLPSDLAATDSTVAPVRQPSGGVILAGDSIAGEVAPAMAEALADQPAPFSFVVQPNLAGYAALAPEWEARIAESDPSIVVVLVGTWERIVVDPAQPDWQQRYVDEVIAPWVQMLTANGTQVVFAAYPPLADNADLPGSGGLNDVWASLPAQIPGVTFVDAGGILRGPDGGFSLTLPFPGVGEVPVRQSDGRHLCPDGVMLVADKILVHLQQLQPTIVPRDGWQRAGWRADPANFEHPELCPGSF
jgi:hypothetical protein